MLVWTRGCLMVTRGVNVKEEGSTCECRAHSARNNIHPSSQMTKTQPLEAWMTGISPTEIKMDYAMPLPAIAEK